MTRILIVDDHPMIVSGCVAMLMEEGDFEIVDASNAEDGLGVFIEHQPDLSIVDIALPGLSGFELTKRILRHDDTAKIVIFSMNDDPIFAARAIESGARGYVPKSENPYLLIEAIHQVLNGSVFLPPKVTQSLITRNFAPAAERLSCLSVKELDILKLLGRGLTMNQIAEFFGVSHKTIANSCSTIKAKLNVHTSMELMRIALELEHSSAT